jgi:hypothetical protein
VRSVAAILDDIKRLDRERDRMMDELQAAVADGVPVARDPPPVALSKSAAGRPKWMLAARAFRDRYPLAAWQVRRICANHDWALKLAATWYVDSARFNEFADKVDRGDASFDSSEKFASSLANGARLDNNRATRKSIAKEDKGDQDRETA